MNSVLVYGLAVAGEAVARALHRRAIPFMLVDDTPSETARRTAKHLGVDLVEAPSADTLTSLIRACDLIVPAPGVPETHPLFDIAQRHQVEACSELELAYRWEQQRPGGARAMLAITGTDGKTSTTQLTAAMVGRAGYRTVAAGNTDLPLISVIDDESVDVFVVEASSFRLATTSQFRAEGSAWLNLAEDHQNWHSGLSSYIAAKAKLWQALRPDDVAVGVIQDPIVRSHLDRVTARRITVGVQGTDYFVADGWLRGPSGPLARVDSLGRALPHDLTNGLTAAALVLETGLGDVAAVAEALAEFRPPRHRIELVAEQHGIRWFDDSKATSPHAALTAVRAFDSMVWIAGGRNKGLDLSVLADDIQHVRAVVALGEASDEIAAVFEGRCPVAKVATMADAVAAAATFAQAGDAVVLSPACASFDAYRNYGERGDDFVRCVHDLLKGLR